MKIPSFEENRQFIENEFEEAVFDQSTGIPAPELEEMLGKFVAENEHLPAAILRARCFEFILDNAQIQINPHAMFASKISIGVDYSYFASIEMMERQLFLPRRLRILTERMEDDFNHMYIGREEIGVGYAWTDFWHNVPNWPNLLKYGFTGILQQAKDNKKKWQESGRMDERQEQFYDAVIIHYEAILRLLRRIYEQSLKYDIPHYSACVLQLTKGAPTNLYEVMEFAIQYLCFHEIGCERARTLGPVDRIYFPYYQADLESGRFTKEQVEELFRYFFMHFTAAKRFAQEPMTLCGEDANGNTYVNELTELMLDVYDSLNIFNPKIHVRYCKSLPDRVFYKITDMIRRGNSSICILNDDVIIPAYEKIGIPREDAADYVVLGCYEPIVMGKEESEIGAAWLNMAKSLEFAISGGFDVLTGMDYSRVKTPTDFATYEEFHQAVIAQIDETVNFSMKNIVDQTRHALDICPSTIYSSGFTECMEQGRDIRDGWPLKYNHISIKCFGMATVVDSMMAVKKFVFEQKLVTYAEFRQALLNNWEGYEWLRTLIRNDEEKYGNNQDRPDALMCELVTHIKGLCDAAPTERGGVFRLGLDSITNNVLFGKGVAATPDGRYHRDRVSKNLCANDGMDYKGVTALMNSLLKLDHTELINSSILDFFLHPSAIEGDKGLESFATLIRTYFARGGGTVQGNIVDGKALRDAQVHPDRYKTLQIRVCGWNEYFVDMKPEEQDIFIKQTERQ